MTLIRRTAQLINDLKLLNMIKDQDKIDCTFIRGVIRLRVDFDSWRYNQYRSIKESVKVAIKTEFEDSYIREAYSTSKSIEFYICKDEITNNKLHEIYLETH